MLWLALPKRNMDPQLVDTQPASVEAWLERLPYTDLLECGRLLAQALYHLGRTPLEPMLRYKLLMLYLKALDRYYPLLEGETQHSDILSSPKSRQLAVVGVKLFSNLFVGFKQALQDKLARPSLLEREQPKVELLLYTMMAARQCLNLYQQYYCPLPDGFWLDCHQLYATAVEKGWQDRSLANDDTLADIYRQILLLGLTATNRLSPAEMQLARQLIYGLAKQVTLLPLGELDENRHGYLLDPKEDAPPRYLLASAAALPHACYLLEMAGALASMRRSLAQLQKASAAASGGQVNEEIHVLTQLSEAWQRPRRRKHSRESAQGVVEVIAGTAQIWHRVNGGSWQLPGAGAAEETSRLRPPPLPCLMTIVNHSDSGYLLRGVPREQPLRAGEILLINPPDQPETARLCAVRWVLMQPTGKEIECGVEILCPAPAPAMVMPSITYHGDTYQRCLLLPPHGNHPELLEMVGRPFSQLREFRLRAADGERLIRASKLHQQSPYFQLMEYRPSELF